MTLTDYLGQHGMALLEGSGTTVLVFVVIKHIPTWPPSIEKIYNWFRDSLQDFASQRTGGNQQNPPNPNPKQ